MDESRKQFEEYVAKKLRLPFEMITEARNGDRYFAFSSMDNPADAWPVIAKHQISICAYERNNPGMKNEYWWEADRFCEFITIDNNPLRAAMIVFLMMQDANNA